MAKNVIERTIGVTATPHPVQHKKADKRLKVGALWVSYEGARLRVAEATNRGLRTVAQKTKKSQENIGKARHTKKFSTNGALFAQTHYLLQRGNNSPKKHDTQC